MKKIILILFVVILVENNTNAQLSNNYQKKDSIDFVKFLNHFPKAKLRENYDFEIEYGGKIEMFYVKKYICNYSNFCGKSFSFTPKSYYYIEQYNEFKNYYVLLYAINEHELPFHRQIVMATFSKNDGRLISKIILDGYMQLNYHTSTKISKNLTFKIKTVIGSQKSKLKPNPLHPKYFWVYESFDNYRLDTRGKFIFMNSTEPVQYIGKLSENIKRVFDYPVKIPTN